MIGDVTFFIEKKLAAARHVTEREIKKKKNANKKLAEGQPGLKSFEGGRLSQFSATGGNNCLLRRV